MQRVFAESHNIISPLGAASNDNFSALRNGISGVQLHTRPDINETPFWASIISQEQFKKISSEVKHAETYSRFEIFLIASVQQALKGSSVDVKDKKTIFIFSTTKGSISLLENEPVTPELCERMGLHHSAKKITEYFKNPNSPVVISNACISGSFALLYAKRLLESGQYDNAVIAGADTVSKFVFSGFQSFQALSAGRCKPFSAQRDGINLGEAAATIILTTKNISNGIIISGGAVTNDSNHISGPSRTGKELSTAIDTAMKMARVSQKDIGCISAHGTATLYNDEMEAKAFNLSGLQAVPVNGLKVFFGHTLGAAGLVESIISLVSLKENIILPVIDFKGPVLEPHINVCDHKMEKKYDHFLKTASGFGGCNAALVFSKS